MLSNSWLASTAPSSAGAVRGFRYQRPEILADYGLMLAPTRDFSVPVTWHRDQFNTSQTVLQGSGGGHSLAGKLRTIG